MITYNQPLDLRRLILGAYRVGFIQHLRDSITRSTDKKRKTHFNKPAKRTHRRYRNYCTAIIARLLTKPARTHCLLISPPPTCFFVVFDCISALRLASQAGICQTCLCESQLEAGSYLVVLLLYVCVVDAQSQCCYFHLREQRTTTFTPHPHLNDNGHFHETKRRPFFQTELFVVQSSVHTNFTQSSHSTSNMPPRVSRRTTRLTSREPEQQSTNEPPNTLVRPHLPALQGTPSTRRQYTYGSGAEPPPKVGAGLQRMDLGSAVNQALANNVDDEEDFVRPAKPRAASSRADDAGPSRDSE